MSGSWAESPALEVTEDLIATLVDRAGYTHPLFHPPPGAGGPPLPGQGVLLLMGGLVEQSGAAGRRDRAAGAAPRALPHAAAGRRDAAGAHRAHRRPDDLGWQSRTGLPVDRGGRRRADRRRGRGRHADEPGRGRRRVKGAQLHIAGGIREFGRAIPGPGRRGRRRPGGHVRRARRAVQPARLRRRSRAGSGPASGSRSSATTATSTSRSRPRWRRRACPPSR